MTEAELQRAVIQAAKLGGWMVVHIRPAMMSDGRWVTAYQGDPGLPDLVLARRGEVHVAELKSARGRPTAEQKAWLAAAGDRGHLWRPDDLPGVARWLTARRR